MAYCKVLIIITTLQGNMLQRYVHIGLKEH